MSKTDQLHGLIDEAVADAKREGREYLGRHLSEMTCAQIEACFDGVVLTPDMAKGFRLAAELVRDQNFDY